jgi:NTP pyrophosphatase (non-canonical NTP hydrolase)
LSISIRSTQPSLLSHREEIGDVGLVDVTNELEIDIATAMRSKMAKNRQKYPAERCQGQFWPPEGETKKG